MCTPGSSAPPHDLCRTPDRQSRPASAVRTKTPRSSPRQGTPSEILSASAPLPSAALSSPACGGLIREGTTFRSTWDNAISCAGRVFANHYDLAAHLLDRARPLLKGDEPHTVIGRVDILFDLLKAIDAATPEKLDPYVEVLSGDFERRPLSEQII